MRRACEEDPTHPPTPWSRGAEAAPVFAHLWATGPDVGLDRAFRLLALRQEQGAWTTFDRLCDPFPEPGAAEEPRSTARMAREFGVTRAELADAVPAEQAWQAFRAFIGDGPLVVLDAEVFTAWYAHHSHGLTPPPCVGLVELAALCSPGRLAQLGPGLVDLLLPAGREGPPAALTPLELWAALGELSGRFLALEPGAIALAARGWAQAAHVLEATDPAAAERLALATALLEHPSRWTASTGGLFAAPVGLSDGRLSAALAGGGRWGEGREGPLEGLLPHAAVLGEAWAALESVPPRRPEAELFAPDDERRLDDLFQVHLPARLAAELGGRPEEYHRPTQHAVAREVSRTLGADHLLLVHAPTGTGKTAAYLAPALLWAVRHGVRVGISTYTRALQEQAMDREVPRMLAALSPTGLAGARVSVLKGRENYLCFRALALLVPDRDAEPEALLAWIALALFALTDPEGDLDRLPQRPPIALADGERYRSRLATLLRAARSHAGCCTRSEDRATCPGLLARKRAERSHVVITNHAFALARPEYFAHLVFDECEHLHEVAESTWSRALALEELRGLLARLHRAGGLGRGALDRLRAELAPSSLARAEADGALLEWQEATEALEELERGARAFLEWRAEALRERVQRDEQGLFHEYLEGPDGRALTDRRLEATSTLDALDGALSGVLESLEHAALRGKPRLRRTLEMARTELTAAIGALVAWIPVKDGQPAPDSLRFRDVERDARGGLVLQARLLLPNVALGEQYYPTLDSAAFVSATTRLAGSFDAAKAYLGLDRTEHPGEAEEREGRRVRTFSAPEVFDYSRALVGVPRDAPDPRDKERYLEYVTRFLDGLGERTRGRILALFTNLDDVRRVGEALAPRFAARRVPLWYQGMPATGKEELSELFRGRVDSVLLGVDTFWFGADFPGETLEYLVIARLPYGVPDRYHFAQCAALGEQGQRRQIYLPRALAKFRQGFGRLMRRTSDRGCVFVLDKRVLDPRHRHFLRELPLAAGPALESAGGAARLVRGETSHVVREALAHMDMLADVRRRGLAETFDAGAAAAPVLPIAPPLLPSRRPPEPPPRVDVSVDELPF